MAGVGLSSTGTRIYTTITETAKDPNFTGEGSERFWFTLILYYLITITK